MPGGNCACLSFSQATSLEEWKGILREQQVATPAWIDAFETPPPRKGCTCGQVETFKKLLLEEMTRRGEMNDTFCQILALDLAAGSGDLDTVRNLCEKNSDLPNHSGQLGLAIPIVRASNSGHEKVTRYLLKKTKPTILTNGGGYWALCLLLDAIFFGFLDIALDIIDEVPALGVTIQPVQRSSPLRFLAMKPDLFRSYHDHGFWKGLVYSCLFWMTQNGLPEWFGIKQMYEAQTLLKRMCEATQGMEKNESWKLAVYEALLEAVENGNKDFFIEIINYNPELLWITEATGQNLFQLAIKFRKEKIFNLIYSLGHTKVSLLRSCDEKNNNILHIAAQLSPTDHLSKISASALKLQREGQWYGEVTTLVSELEVVQKNNKGMTPRQVFEESHEPLRKEGEEWMKYTAAACSFVAALIATVTFQAIFTVPGGTDETSGTPLLLKDLHFIAFIMSDALAFFTSCTSVLIFLNILTARYSFDDFIVTLPRKMIFGLAILFFSIASLLVAFITALSASMRQKPALVVPMKPLASLPGVFFFMLQYPLLKEMISSTYGKGIFHRNTESWFLVPKETQIVNVASSSQGSLTQTVQVASSSQGSLTQIVQVASSSQGSHSHLSINSQP